MIKNLSDIENIVIKMLNDKKRVQIEYNSKNGTYYIKEIIDKVKVKNSNI